MEVPLLLDSATLLLDTLGGFVSLRASETNLEWHLRETLGRLDLHRDAQQHLPRRTIAPRSLCNIVRTVW
jgi:hypothetical protein